MVYLLIGEFFKHSLGVNIQYCQWLMQLTGEISITELFGITFTLGRKISQVVRLQRPLKDRCREFHNWRRTVAEEQVSQGQTEKSKTT